MGVSQQCCWWNSCSAPIEGLGTGERNHSTGTERLSGLLAQMPVLVYTQNKTQILSLTILISKIHKVGLDTARDYLCFQPFPLLLEPPHLHCVSFCLLIIYLDTQKWNHRSSVKSSTFRNKAWCHSPAPSGDSASSKPTPWTGSVTCHHPTVVTWCDLLGGQRTAQPTGPVHSPFLIQKTLQKQQEHTEDIILLIKEEFM